MSDARAPGVVVDTMVISVPGAHEDPGARRLRGDGVHGGWAVQFQHPVVVDHHIGAVTTYHLQRLVPPRRVLGNHFDSVTVLQHLGQYL